jgi:hypothetical protein
MHRDQLPGTTASAAAENSGVGGAVANLVARISSAPPLLPEYALHYFDSLSAKFQTLPEPASDDALARKAYQDAKRVVQTPREMLTWSDLLLLDLSITRSLPFDVLRLRIADLRVKLEGQAALPDGLVPKLDDAKPADIEALRAEAEVLVTRVWHLRMARNARDRYVADMRHELFKWLLCIVSGFMVLSVLIADVPLYFVIITAGMLGALMSFLRRLQAVRMSTPNADDLSGLAHEKRAALVALVTGAVFAMVLYMAFAAGLSQLAGELAPQFEFPSKYPEGGADFLAFTLLVGPATGVDYAKVVIWCFVAGFFEQLVPDVLDRVVKK